MKLEGSCHCRKVRFRVEAHEPVPFMRCYCSICRKTAGGGGYAMNLGADFRTLKVRGRKFLGIYRARMSEDGRRRSGAQRHFCTQCGSALWLWDPDWPDLVHPHASAIDTDLPATKECTHILLDSKANWVPVQPVGKRDKRFKAYPKESLAEWHERTGSPR